MFFFPEIQWSVGLRRPLRAVPDQLTQADAAARGSPSKSLLRLAPYVVSRCSMVILELFRGFLRVPTSVLTWFSMALMWFTMVFYMVFTWFSPLASALPAALPASACPAGPPRGAAPGLPSCPPRRALVRGSYAFQEGSFRIFIGFSWIFNGISWFFNGFSWNFICFSWIQQRFHMISSLISRDLHCFSS